MAFHVTQPDWTERIDSLYVIRISATGRGRVVVYVEAPMSSTTKVLVDFIAVFFGLGLVPLPAAAHAGDVGVEVSRQAAVHSSLQERCADVRRLEKLSSALVQLCQKETHRVTNCKIVTVIGFHKGSGTFWRGVPVLTSLFTVYSKEQSADWNTVHTTRPFDLYVSRPHSGTTAPVHTVNSEGSGEVWTKFRDPSENPLVPVVKRKRWRQ